MPAPTWTVVHYEKEDGECPIRDFLDGLNDKERAKALAAIDLLEEKGPNLPRPYADTLKDGIHELRVRVSRLRYRVFYFFCDRTDIVLSHGFKKMVSKVPEPEIDRARKCRADWLRRHHEDTMKTHREYLNEKLQDPGFAEQYRCERQKLRIAFEIHDARVKLGLSQKALARRAGLTQQMVSRVENASKANMSQSTVCKIADALGMDVGLVARR